MRKLIVFNNVSLDGYFADARSDMSWAHNQDAEWLAFAAENAGGGGTLLLGRVTYDMMAAWWPSPAAAKAAPEVAEGMNRLQKVVFSRTMKKADWQNTTLVKSDIVGAVKKLKDEPGEGMVILGSGSIVSQLTEAGLIDEYQIIVHPIVLGSGRSMFEGVTNKVPLALKKTRVFGNGNVVMWLERRA